MSKEQLGLLKIDDKSIISGLLQKTRNEDAGYEIVEECQDEEKKVFYRYFKEHLTSAKLGSASEVIKIQDEITYFYHPDRDRVPSASGKRLTSPVDLVNGYFKALFGGIGQSVPNDIEIKIAYSKPDFKRGSVDNKNFQTRLGGAISAQIDRFTRYSKFGKNPSDYIVGEADSVYYELIDEPNINTDRYRETEEILWILDFGALTLDSTFIRLTPTQTISELSESEKLGSVEFYDRIRDELLKRKRVKRTFDGLNEDKQKLVKWKLQDFIEDSVINYENKEERDPFDYLGIKIKEVSKKLIQDQFKLFLKKISKKLSARYEDYSKLNKKLPKVVITGGFSEYEPLKKEIFRIIRNINKSFNILSTNLENEEANRKLGGLGLAQYFKEYFEPKSVNIVKEEKRIYCWLKIHDKYHQVFAGEGQRNFSYDDLQELSDRNDRDSWIIDDFDPDDLNGELQFFASPPTTNSEFEDFKIRLERNKYDKDFRVINKGNKYDDLIKTNSIKGITLNLMFSTDTKTITIEPKLFIEYSDGKRRARLDKKGDPVRIEDVNPEPSKTRTQSISYNKNEIYLGIDFGMSKTTVGVYDPNGLIDAEYIEEPIYAEADKPNGKTKKGIKQGKPEDGEDSEDKSLEGKKSEPPPKEKNNKEKTVGVRQEEEKKKEEETKRVSSQSTSDKDLEKHKKEIEEFLKKNNKEKGCFDNNNEKWDTKTGEELITEIKSRMDAIGYETDDKMIKNLLLCIQTGSMTILTGPPGFGKTSLIKSFMHAIGQQNRLCNISVQRNWFDQSELFGFYNFANNRYQFANNDLLPLLIAANKAVKDKNDNLFFAPLLDEINLSTPEYYMSTIMTAISGAEGEVEYMDKLSGGMFEGILPNPLQLHTNTHFFGTANIDETVERFSPRFLDRANLIELNGNSGDYFRGAELKFDAVKDKDALKIPDPNESDPNELEELKTIVKAFTDGEGKKFFISPRTILSIEKYVKLAENYAMEEKNDALDIQILQRILPKLRGFGDSMKLRLQTIMKKLSAKEEKKQVTFDTNGKIETKPEEDKLFYKNSFIKVEQIYQSGFDMEDFDFFG